jgi:nitroreductase
MEISEAIRTKRAIRQFKDEALSDEVVNAILNAGRRSPTASNKQYLTFIAIDDKETQAKLAATAQGAGHLARAPFVVAIVASAGEMGDALVNFDIGQAATYMMLEAWDAGVGSNIARMRDEDAVRAALNLPADTESGWAISFGYPAAEDATTAPMKSGGRKELDEVVRWGKWE